MQLIDMVMIYYWDKKLKKGLHVLESDIIPIKKSIDLISLSQTFLLDVFQLTDIVLVLVINHYHMNGLHLFWDTQYLVKLRKYYRISVINHCLSNKSLS